MANIKPNGFLFGLSSTALVALVYTDCFILYKEFSYILFFLKLPKNLTLRQVEINILVFTVGKSETETVPGTDPKLTSLHVKEAG